MSALCDVSPFFLSLQSTPPRRWALFNATAFLAGLGVQFIHLSNIGAGCLDWAVTKHARGEYEALASKVS